jgi:hypothetical protein
MALALVRIAIALSDQQAVDRDPQGLIWIKTRIVRRRHSRLQELPHSEESPHVSEQG